MSVVRKQVRRPIWRKKVRYPWYCCGRFRARLTITTVERTDNGVEPIFFFVDSFPATTLSAAVTQAVHITACEVRRDALTGCSVRCQVQNLKLALIKAAASGIV